MNWFYWTLVGFYGLNTILNATQIGVKREPLTKGQFIASLILSTAIVVGILYYGMEA
jgi:hypothetical protein